MKLIELEKEIKKHKVVQALKEGVMDAVVHGQKNDEQTHHYYKQGYDFGLVLHSDQIDMIYNHKYGDTK